VALTEEQFLLLVSSSFVIPEQGAKESFWIQTGILSLLASTLAAYKKIGNINNAIQKMDNYTLCRKLGGMRQECASLIPWARPTTKDKSPSKAGAI